MEHSTTTRHRTRWMQQGEIGRERGFRASLLRVAAIDFGPSIFCTISAGAQPRTLVDPQRGT